MDGVKKPWRKVKQEEEEETRKSFRVEKVESCKELHAAKAIFGKKALKYKYIYIYSNAHI